VYRLVGAAAFLHYGGREEVGRSGEECRGRGREIEVGEKLWNGEVGGGGGGSGFTIVERR
jgi:hypothetical protein